MSLNKMSSVNIFTEEMERSHELSVGSIEVSNFATEVSYQFERWKTHNEMLKTPFTVLLGDLVPSICNLSINVASQLH